MLEHIIYFLKMSQWISSHSPTHGFCMVAKHLLYKHYPNSGQSFLLCPFMWMFFGYLGGNTDRFPPHPLNPSESKIIYFLGLCSWNAQFRCVKYQCMIVTFEKSCVWMPVDGDRVKIRHADTAQVSRGTRQREKQVLHMWVELHNLVLPWKQFP